MLIKVFWSIESLKTQLLSIIWNVTEIKGKCQWFPRNLHKCKSYCPKRSLSTVNSVFRWFHLENSSNDLRWSLRNFILFGTYHTKEEKIHKNMISKLKKNKHLLRIVGDQWGFKWSEMFESTRNFSGIWVAIVLESEVCSRLSYSFTWFKAWNINRPKL